MTYLLIRNLSLTFVVFFLTMFAIGIHINYNIEQCKTDPTTPEPWKRCYIPDNETIPFVSIISFVSGVVTMCVMSFLWKEQTRIEIFNKQPIMQSNKQNPTSDKQ